MDELLTNSAVRYSVLILLFVAVAGVTLVLAGMFGERREMRERLASGSSPSDDEMVSPGAGLRVHDARGAWVALVTAIEKAGVPLVDTKDATLRSQLRAALQKTGVARQADLIGLIVGLPAAHVKSGNLPSRSVARAAARIA